MDAGATEPVVVVHVCHTPTERLKLKVRIENESTKYKKTEDIEIYYYNCLKSKGRNRQQGSFIKWLVTLGELLPFCKYQEMARSKQGQEDALCCTEHCPECWILS